METLYKIKAKLLTVFGDLKYFKTPPSIVYQPTTFKIKGSDTRRIMNLIQEGDIILRGYDCYLDSLFIPGKFSHTGIYIGEGKMIHSIAEGVSEIDIIDFLRCDRFCVLRPTGYQESAIARLRKWIGTPYDFNFESWNTAYYCHELGAMAYYELEIEKKIPIFFKGLFKAKPTYLAESFLENPNFKVIEELIP